MELSLSQSHKRKKRRNNKANNWGSRFSHINNNWNFSKKKKKKKGKRRSENHGSEQSNSPVSVTSLHEKV